jgi:methionyl-tRNA formyltransferase
LSTVFIGTSEFAADVLERLARSDRHRPVLVLTRPDRPSGRGRRLTAPPVAERALGLGLALGQPTSVNDPDARAQIAAALEPTREHGSRQSVVVCAFGALIKEPLLSAYEMLNVHPSLLPRWRGAAPVERAIMAGDERTGVSIMRLTEGLDSGPVCAQAPEPIGDQDTYGTLADRLRATGGELLISVLDERPPCRDQDEAQATYAEKLTAADRVLDPGRPAVELERAVRALSPHIGAAVMLAGGSRLGVWQARVVDRAGLEPGALSLDGPLPALGCSPGALELLVVQPPGGRAMPAGDYLRGRRG